jgi:hypothetical protein
MAGSLKVLCMHGVGDHHTDSQWQESWRAAILQGVHRWDPKREVETEFVLYDRLFDQASLSLADTLNALRKLLGSGLRYGVEDLFGRRRGLGDLPDTLRWTAGMVVQWVENDELRAATRDLLWSAVQRQSPDVVLAHSLGSLVCYDTFLRSSPREVLGETTFVSFGSQIGNPFVRASFGGRLVPVPTRKWYHLYNGNDDVLTCPIRIEAPTFEQVTANFDLPGIGDHDATGYLTHPGVVDRVWGSVVGSRAYRTLSRARPAFAKLSRTPDRRALLVGINEYPNKADRLEGCVNDVFLVSSVLQECGFDPDDIRVVLDQRATAAGIRERLGWLLDGVAAGDQRVFYYSGHGAQIRGYGIGEKIDRLDECLVPCDFDWTPEHAIIDDELYDLYSQLPYDARLVMLLDCCHSGGMTRDGGPRIRGLTPPDDIRHRALRWNAALQMWEERSLDSPNRSLADGSDGEDYLGQSGVKRRLGRAIGLRALPNKEYDAACKQLGHRGPYLPMIYQACREDEYAYEYRHGVVSYGAFTYAMARAIRQHKQASEPLTFRVLRNVVARTLRQLRYDQHPALVGPRDLCSSPIPW